MPARRKRSVLDGPGYAELGGNPLRRLKMPPGWIGEPEMVQSPQAKPRARPWPTGVVIVQDTREQDPWTWPTPEGASPPRSIVGTLQTGDYSVRGLEHLCAIERKSLEDAWSSIGSGRKYTDAAGVAHDPFHERRDCFEREWQRLAQLRRAAVIIEASLEELARPNPRSLVDPSVVIGTYCRWGARYGIPVLYCGTRKMARDYATRTLICWYELLWPEAQPAGASGGEAE